MQISAEIRWFWRTALPPAFEDWFHSTDNHSCPAGGGQERVDEYLRDAHQPELGLKRRGGKPGVEVKGLVAVIQSGVAERPFAGPVELWAKWTSEPLELKPDSTIAIKKQRWLRKFDTAGRLPEEISLGADEKPIAKARPLPARGCNVELTRVQVPTGDVWWTLGFEAFGTLQTVEDDLRAAASVLAKRRPPELRDALLVSYPAWLKEHA